jgi:hypothetical protein
VVNFGQLGFVSTQGVVQLENELRQRDRPDVVIFYDGVNDTVSGSSSRRAGLHLAYEEIRRRVEAPRLHDTSPRWAELLSWSNLNRLISRLVTKAAPKARDEPRPDSLVNAVVATYLENVRIVKSLATTYGFHAAFFWQPSLATGGKPLSGVERAIQEAEVSIPFARRVHARFRAQAAHDPDVHDLSTVLDQESALTYLDWHHTTPEANRTIARAIAEAVSR